MTEGNEEGKMWGKWGATQLAYAKILIADEKNMYTLPNNNLIIAHRLSPFRSDAMHLLVPRV